jgi:D-proline reductase (dithiol) PrdB
MEKIPLKIFKDRLLSLVIARFPSLFRRWEKNADILTFEDTYWADPPDEPFSAKIALVTTGGIHLKNDEPFDMDDRDGDPSYRVIPSSVPEDGLTITHNYYDVRDALKDPEIIFPLQTLLSMEKSGEVGQVNSRHFSFMGHIQGRHLSTLLEKSAPQVAASLNEDGVGAVILSPA